jgi:hypothetical protein
VKGRHRNFRRNLEVLLAVSVIACGIFDGCSLSNNSWFLREYQNTAPHDRAVLERQDKILEVECVDTTFSDGSKAPVCGWLAQHVGEHLQDGDGFQQITRTGSAVCYHDNMGGRECYTIIRERAK